MKDSTILWSRSAWVKRRLFHLGDIGLKSLVSLNPPNSLRLSTAGWWNLYMTGGHPWLCTIWKVSRVLGRSYLMTLHVIFPIHVNFPITSRCIFKVTIHRRKTVNCFTLLEEVFFKKTLLSYCNACYIWLICNSILYTNKLFLNIHKGFSL